MKKGLLITELMGSSINYSNGDYSRGASGFWIENGEILFPVSEITVAGNLNKIFSELIPADDLKFNFGVNAPSVLVENMTLGGIQFVKEINYSEIERKCKFALIEAGKISKKLKKDIKVSYKSKNQRYNADLEINNFLKFFATINSDYGWLSEESIDDKSRLK